HRVGIHHHGTAFRPRPDRRQPLLEVVMEAAPPIDVPLRATARAVATLVVGVGVDPGGGQVIADVLVATGVLAETVDEEQRRTRIRHTTGPQEQLDAVRRDDTTDEGGHEAARMHDLWVCRTVGSRSARRCSFAATSSSTRTSG